MGKSILILLILIIMLVAAPIFGSFGEVADKPVVVSSPSCSECFMKHHQNIEYQLEPSIAVPLKTAYIQQLVRGEVAFLPEERTPGGFVKSNGLIIMTDEEIHKINDIKERYFGELDIIPDPIPGGSAKDLLRMTDPFGQIAVPDDEIHKFYDIIVDDPIPLESIA